MTDLIPQPQQSTRLALQCLSEGKLDEALEHARDASCLAGHDPMMHNNEGVILHAMGKHEDALACHERALALNPTLLHALVNRAAPLRDSGHPAQAHASLLEALQAHPGNLAARWNLALLLLAQGEYAEAWPLFECRWEPGGHCATLIRAGEPAPWRGDLTGLHGKRLLVRAEQGLGDAIQFARFVPELAQHVSQVVLEVQAPLLRLMQHTLGAVAEVVPLAANPPSADFSVGVMSLAGICGVKAPNDLERRHDTGPGLCISVPEDVLKGWAVRLGPRRRPRVGLMWSGNPLHAQNRRRSVPLRQMLDVLTRHWHDAVELVSLHKDLPHDDLAYVNSHRHLSHWGANQNDLMDAAALCQLCDAVLTVDTSIAHLAAALHRPTWVLLHASADWRWGLSGERTPWYPSARLMRQDAWGDWQGVLGRAAIELQAWIDQQRSPL